ncbi:MAG: hypothetical protein JWL83_504 [Actinomycetia bacterium]|nr:hypothetical protein [Actinomycetes bacterium]
MALEFALWMAHPEAQRNVDAGAPQHCVPRDPSHEASGTDDRAGASRHPVDETPDSVSRCRCVRAWVADASGLEHALEPSEIEPGQQRRDGGHHDTAGG